MAAGIRRKAASLKPLERRFSKKRNHADVSGGRYDRGPRRINEHSRTAVQKSLQTQLRRGFRGYPVATIAYYGPDDAHASKVAVGIVRGDGEAVAELRRWSSAETDVSLDTMINREIVDFIQVQGARTVAGVDRIIGCPHEEGVDYQQGGLCPACPFWANRDRWTGDSIH